MDIEYVREKKKILEEAILPMIVSFEKEITLRVKDIDYTTTCRKIPRGFGMEFKEVSEVKIELESI